jgi:hypothetical protein
MFAEPAGQGGGQTIRAGTPRVAPAEAVQHTHVGGHAGCTPPAAAVKHGGGHRSAGQSAPGGHGGPGGQGGTHGCSGGHGGEQRSAFGGGCEERLTACRSPCRSRRAAAWWWRWRGRTRSVGLAPGVGGQIAGPPLVVRTTAAAPVVAVAWTAGPQLGLPAVPPAAALAASVGSEASEAAQLQAITSDRARMPSKFSARTPARSRGRGRWSAASR